jgi:hypothetical protein
VFTMWQVPSKTLLRSLEFFPTTILLPLVRVSLSVCEAALSLPVAGPSFFVVVALCGRLGLS